MSAGDLAVTLAALVCVIGFAALIVVLVRVLDTLKAVRLEVESLRRETGPLLAELRESTDEAREAMDTAREDLERFDRVLGSAEAISDAVDGSSRLVRRAFSAPMIKAAGLATGTSRTARRLRRKESSTALVHVSEQPRRRA
jgi:predicted phage gp36 major capsid-like protein